MVVRRVAVKVNLKVGQGSILRIGPRKHKLSLTIIFSAVGVARRAAQGARRAATRRRGGRLEVRGGAGGMSRREGELQEGGKGIHHIKSQ